MLRAHTIHSYIVDTTPDENGRFFESPYAVHGKMHTNAQDSEYYDMYIKDKEFSDDSEIQMNISFERKENNEKTSAGESLKKKLLLLGSAE